MEHVNNQTTHVSVKAYIFYIFPQKKLEAELQSIEEKHEAKKRKFFDSSDKFHQEMKKVRSPG